MWLWDALTGLFKDEDGNLLSRHNLEEMLQASMDYSVQACLQSVLGGLTGAPLYNQMRDVIKYEYIRQYIAGAGGIGNMTYRDWGSIGGMLREQYAYVRDFVSEVGSGTLSDAQINQRISMFINSSSEAYQRSHGRVASRLGYDEVAWNLTPGMNHCPICEERNKMGYVAVGPKGGFLDRDGESFPGDGNTPCLTACGCYLSYRNSVTGEEYLL